MKKSVLLVVSTILLNIGLNAQCAGRPAHTDTSHLTDWPSPIMLSVDCGYRQDKFKWSIAGADDTPNVLSELKWQDLQIVQLSGYASYTSSANYTVRVSGDYGYIYSGRNIDTDFLSDDKINAFSKSTNKAGKGSVYDVEAGVGYRVTTNGKRFIGTPLVGYSYHGQNLHMFDGKSDFFILTTDSGQTFIFPEAPIPDLDSSYKTRWYGPWIGFDFTTKVEACTFLFGSIELHQVDYRGTGHWNLRNDIGPFHHTAKGAGIVIKIGTNWEIWDRWSIGLVGNYRYFKTRHGREQLSVFVPGFIEPFDVETRFNGARWQSWGASALVAYRF